VYLKQLNIKETGEPVMIVFCVGIVVIIICEVVLYVRGKGEDKYFTPMDKGKGK